MPGSVVSLAVFLHLFLKVKILILPNLLFKENGEPEIELEGSQFNVFHFVRNMKLRHLIKQSLNSVSLPHHCSEKSERLFVPHFRTK